MRRIVLVLTTLGVLTIAGAARADERFAVRYGSHGPYDRVAVHEVHHGHHHPYYRGTVVIAPPVIAPPVYAYPPPVLPYPPTPTVVYPARTYAAPPVYYPAPRGCIELRTRGLSLGFGL